MAFFEPKELDEDSIYEELKPALIRNKLLLGVLFTSIVAGVYGMLLYKSDQFESTALILVMLGRENTEAPIAAENATIFTDGVRAEEINSYVRILSSHSLIEDTIDAIGVERFFMEQDPPDGLVARAKYEVKKVAKVIKKQVDSTLIYVGLRANLSDREKVIKLLKRSLVVARERDSNVISVSLRLVDPGLAQDIVQELIDQYSQRHIALRKNENIQMAFEGQTALYRGQLLESRDKMATIRMTWNITSIDEQRSVLVGQVIRVQAGLDQKNSLLAQSKSQEDSIMKLLPTLSRERRQSESKERNPTLKFLHDEIARLQVERIETSKRYDEGSVVLGLIDSKIEDVKSLIKFENEQVIQTVIFEPNPLYDDLSLRVSILTVEQDGILSGIEQDTILVKKLREEIEHLNEGANLLEMAELDYRVLEDRFKSNAARAEQAKIKQALDAQNIANVTLVGGPTYSEEPVAPRRLLIMAVGTAAALVMSIALVLLKEWASARIYGRRELESISGVKFLGKFRLHG